MTILKSSPDKPLTNLEIQDIFLRKYRENVAKQRIEKGWVRKTMLGASLTAYDMCDLALHALKMGSLSPAQHLAQNILNLPKSYQRYIFGALKQESWQKKWAGLRFGDWMHPLAYIARIVRIRKEKVEVLCLQQGDDRAKPVGMPEMITGDLISLDAPIPSKYQDGKPYILEDEYLLCLDETLLNTIEMAEFFDTPPEDLKSKLSTKIKEHLERTARKVLTENAAKIWIKAKWEDIPFAEAARALGIEGKEWEAAKKNISRNRTLLTEEIKLKHT